MVNYCAVLEGLRRMREEDPDGFSSDILNYLQEKNAEIDSLKNELKASHTLREQMNDKLKSLEHKYNTSTSEATKFFANLAIKRICENVPAPTPLESYIVERCNQEIDKLAKEMRGVDDA